MLDGIEGYTGAGGRLMYMGGNGFYWRVAFRDDKPGVMEMRRAEDGSRSWIAEPGEYHMSFTGELGGLWWRCGRTPQSVTGVGFIAQGFDWSSPYRRQPGSHDPRAAWIFDGVGKDELIGDFGLLGNGAAGWELDCADPARGTPPHALVLASSFDHSDTVLLVAEEIGHMHPMIYGSLQPRVHADLVFFETPNGGAVWSTGSIALVSSLPCNNFDNNVATVTRNVIERFCDTTPF
jgi:N,N-dimethylformamidase